MGEELNVPANATEITNKYMKLEDPYNCKLKKSLFHPLETWFNSNFFLSAIKENKKYLIYSFKINYNIGGT